MRKLYQIILHNGSQKVYDDNLPFTRVEPNEEDIIYFMKLIQPDLIFDKTEWVYIRELKDTEL